MLMEEIVHRLINGYCSLQGFHTSQVSHDYSHQQYHEYRLLVRGKRTETEIICLSQKPGLPKPIVSLSDAIGTCFLVETCLV